MTLWYATFAIEAVAIVGIVVLSRCAEIAGGPR